MERPRSNRGHETGAHRDAQALESISLGQYIVALVAAVVIVADTCIAGPGFAAAKAEGDRRVLAALSGVMNHAVRSPLLERHVECVEDAVFSAVPIAQPTILQLQASRTTER